MKKNYKYFTFLIVSVTLGLGCTQKDLQVSFKKDVMPIFQENCSSCHKEGGEGFLASGFSVESYESIMKGTKFGSVVEAGQA